MIGVQWKSGNGLSLHLLMVEVEFFGYVPRSFTRSGAVNNLHVVFTFQGVKHRRLLTLGIYLINIKLMNRKVDQPLQTIGDIPIPGEPGSSPGVNRRTITLIALAVGVFLLTVLAVYLFRSGLLTAPTGTKPPPISKPVPATAIPNRGLLTAINGTNITVAVYGKSRIFSLAKTRDFKKVISGTVEKGDARVGPSSLSALKAGQEILVIVDKSSAQVKAVYIIKE